MKLPLLSLIVAFLLLNVTHGFAQQENLSDFEIQKNFKEDYRLYKDKVDTVALADSAQAIMDQIQSLEEEYGSHEELLDKALYPETYEGLISELTHAAKLAANRLQTMEQQDDQLTTLQLRLMTYQEHVYQLTQQAESLQQAMQESIESEKQLSGMVRNYRENLEQRDELVLDFIDSTIVAYQQMDLQTFRELEEMDSGARLNADGNVLQMISDIAAENVNILQADSSNMRIEDYMRMQTVQQRFDQMWNQLGSKITEIYGESDAEEIAGEVESNIDDWDQLLHEKTFAAMNDSLKATGLEINNFGNAEEFNSSLNTYLDSVITRSKEGATEEDYAHFQTFREFWNRVERQWSGNFRDAGIMTGEQMAAISDKTDTWSQYAEPESNTMTYLLIAVALVAVVLGGLLIREKTKRTEDTNEYGEGIS